jgi:hypothetical protein
MSSNVTYTLDHRPKYFNAVRKKTTVDISFITVPFTVVTQEGPLLISPETVDDWEGGYYVAYPSDGSKPYPISRSFIRANYELV